MLLLEANSNRKVLFFIVLLLFFCDTYCFVLVFILILPSFDNVLIVLGAIWTTTLLHEPYLNLASKDD